VLGHLNLLDLFPERCTIADTVLTGDVNLLHAQCQLTVPVSARYAPFPPASQLKTRTAPDHRVAQNRPWYPAASTGTRGPPAAAPSRRDAREGLPLCCGPLGPVAGEVRKQIQPRSGPPNTRLVMTRFHDAHRVRGTPHAPPALPQLTLVHRAARRACGAARLGALAGASAPRSLPHPIAHVMCDDSPPACAHPPAPTPPAHLLSVLAHGARSLRCPRALGSFFSGNTLQNLVYLATNSRSRNVLRPSKL
jgi:hypothetical protein